MEVVTTVLSYAGYIILFGAVVAGFIFARLLWKKKTDDTNKSDASWMNNRTMQKHWQLIALAVIGLALFFILFDQIEAVLAWLGIGWTTLFVLIGVIVLFMGAKHYRAAGNSIAAGGLYAVATLVAAGFTYQLLADEKLPFASAVKAAEVPTGEDWDNVSFEPGTDFTFRARRSVVFDASAVGLAYKCSTVNIGEHYEWDYQEPNLVVTPGDSMFAGGVVGVEAFTTPAVTANRAYEPALWQAQVDAQNAFIIEKRTELGCPGY